MITPLPSIKIYKRIALIFVTVAAILAIVIAYFSFGQAEVKVELKKRSYQTEFFINVGQKNVTTESVKNFVAGKILTTQVEGSNSFSATGKKTASSQSKIVGKIKVQNSSDQTYNFIAKTRFLSASGILFRMQNPAQIPANGSVEVDVYPDDSKFTGSLEPTTFTIPGLSVEKQKLVSGITEKTLTAAQGDSVYYITADDIKNAEASLTEQLKTKGLAELQDQLKFREKIFEPGTQVKIISEEAKPVVDTVAENFTLNLKVEVMAVSLAEADLVDEVKLKTIEQLPINTEIVNFDPAKLVYTVEKYDETGQVVVFKVNYNGEIIVTKNNAIFETENLMGLTKQEVENYLIGFDDVKSVKVKLWPFWVQRVPNVADKIDLILVK